MLEDGTYTLNDMLWISGNGITFRSRSGNRDAVTIRGQGMYGSVSHIFNVPGSDFTAAEMTIGWVANHAIQIHSDSDNLVVYNVRFVDTGEQMLKVSYRPGDNTSSENGTAEQAVVDQGQSLSEVTQDIDCEMRPKGAGYDIGADEL
ncbi:MAG: hypothetical protein GY861_21875 [bacterium]|nr:hypothetical protein [bacterium]